MVIMIFILAVIILAAIAGRRNRRRRDQELRESLLENFGNVARNNKIYPDGRWEQIPRYYEKHRCSWQIDDITWNDLEMDRLYRIMDTTNSGAGEEYLYWLLRTPALGDDGSRCEPAALDWWRDHPKERVDIQRILQEMGRNGKYSLYDYLEMLDKVKDRPLYRDLPAILLPLLSGVLMAAWNVQIGLICLLVSFGYNMVSYFRIKSGINPYLTTFRYVLRLLSCGSLIADRDIPIYSDQCSVMRQSAAEFADFRRGSGILLRDTMGASGNPADILMDYICILFHLDIMKFGSMLRQLRGREERIDALVTAVGRIDAECAAASWRESLPYYCVPGFTRNPEYPASKESIYRADDLYHPMLEHPVANSIDVCRPVLLTGSNASGKSTFLKAAALGALLAQTVSTVPARFYRAPKYRVFTSMALRDDLSGGESYFIVEIRSLKRILDASSDGSGLPVLCCVDEVLRGTNTVERISASTEILRTLAVRNITVFAATHDLELTELLKNLYDNYHFTEDLSEGDVRFSYRLLHGSADSRNAILLLRALGYDSQIADRAQERAGHFLETGEWRLGDGE